MLHFNYRPSSRGANSDYYPIYEGQNYPYMHGHNSSYTPYIYSKLQTSDQQPPNILDPERLEAFRKNWEYYKMWNSQVYRINVRRISLSLLGNFLMSGNPANSSYGYDHLNTYFRNKKNCV